MADCIGTIIGVSTSGTDLRVRFDGYSTINTIHKTYLETIVTEAAE
jgi:hypothetical protein